MVSERPKHLQVPACLGFPGGLMDSSQGLHSPKAFWAAFSLSPGWIPYTTQESKMKTADLVRRGSNSKVQRADVGPCDSAPRRTGTAATYRWLAGLGLEFRARSLGVYCLRVPVELLG